MLSAHSSQESTPERSRSVPAVLTAAVWAMFVFSVAVAAGWFAAVGHAVRVGDLVAIDGLTLVMWTAVTFFSGIVHSFSRRYLAADPNVDRFFGRVFLLTLVVTTMTAADHLALFVLAWGAMGWLMADLIGHVRGWPQARAAGRLARKYFLAGTGLVAVSAGLLWQETDEYTISGVVTSLESFTEGQLIAAALLVGAAMVQSALFPFHTWLLSSMTAPTPASAMMHAGFVNAGGILLARFAPVFGRSANAMLAIAVVGATSALVAQAWMLVQTDVKSRLGCSTVAQMGFMILQCGLGFFAAAVTHLIVHGFYKAYMFLSSGMRIEQTEPKAKGGHGDGGLPLVVRGPVLLATAIGAGVLFAVSTGKDLTTLNTGLFLTAVIVLSGLHAARELIDRDALSPLVRIVGVPVLMVPATLSYAAVYDAVSAMTYDLPMIHVTLELTAVHWAILAAFVLGHVVLVTGWHRRSAALYAALLNHPQPEPTTVLTEKEEYDDV